MILKFNMQKHDISKELDLAELVLDGEEILVADEALTKTISLVVHFDLSEQGA